MRVTIEPQWTLGDRLAKARRHAGLSQAELARRLGIHRNTVGWYESDRHTDSLTYRVLIAWANECGVTVAWLLGDERTIECSLTSTLATAYGLQGRLFDYTRAAA